MKIVVTRQAQADITQAAEWYEAKGEGLGDKFLDRVGDALDRIALNPHGYAAVFRDLRRCVVPRFPYALWFRIQGGTLIVACLHSKRNPSLATERAMGIAELPKRDLFWNLLAERGGFELALHQ